MSFHRFYETWLNQLHRLLDQHAEAPKRPTTAEQNHHLLQLVHKIMNHYAEFYRVKSLAAKHDVFYVYSAPWSTSLERSLHWIGGWRPTIVFHLFYTESGILFDARMVDIIRGVRTGDLGDLSTDQFHQISDLQCETVHEENVITGELSEWQDDPSDLLGVDLLVDAKMERLAAIIEKADDLRLRTVTRVVELLTIQQAAEFLTAAAELQFGVREWGLDQDHHRHHGDA
ncbi:protein DOG1-like 4 [Cornus florida]|uniref:protein DOG1-like 4 n=1 Tax=Cornus florida TaxID=4283 RepID=UPI00289801B2|nr:protein DOG1-like 4 [Cornus florida]